MFGSGPPSNFATANNDGMAVDEEQNDGNQERSEKSENSEGTNPSMLGTFSDPDALDCPICCEALTSRVFQCENGHIACSSCSIQIESKCPSCSLPIYIRCRSIERILNSVKFSCQNSKYGCKETMIYRKREVHEKSCIFAPCYCPVKGCEFVSSSKDLYPHLKGSHARFATQFDYNRPFKFWLESLSKFAIFEERTDGTIFILKRSCNYVDAINLICIGSLHSKEEFCYELSFKYGGKKKDVKSFTLRMPKRPESHRLTFRSNLELPTVGCIDMGVICIDKD